ncbi:uncharacterized protein LOC129298976 [Prosopis cineraria]|uniref:uncharacterized protein LOC129298976 n=1 Tax=Prosopis cineraria TaxID=364024 RepID=UPI00240F8909|nr:uncharacterized protein LOC129298976 [Prosopis cineraria]
MLGGATTYYGIFPSLTSLELFSLPKLKCTCPWLNKLEWPMLKVLDVHHCDQLKIFPTEDQDHPSDGEAIVPFEKGFPNIEQLSLDKEDIMRINCQALWISISIFPKGITSQFRKLQVACSNFKEIFSSQRHDIDFDLGMLFPQLKGLELMSLQCLESIGLDQSWVAPILENLETFLDLLEELSIGKCGSIQEIVPKKDDGSDEDELTFQKLKTLSLDSLQRLGSFHSGNSTLNFPCLELLTVDECPRMRIFSCGSINASQHLRVSAKPSQHTSYRPQYCGPDLNGHIKLLFSSQVALRDVQNLELGDYPGLQEIWQRETPVPDGGFSKLKTLIVDGCHFLSKNVIPFHLLGLICNLEDLQVRNCGSVKAIFEVGSLSSFFSIPLKTLTLEQLPDLEHVWNEDPQEFLSFQSLQQLHVNGCSSLKSLFPASMAHGKLGRLEILEVRWCKGLVEIVAWDETMLGGATTYYGIFPSLTSLELFSLPKLKCTCPWLNKLEWPMLKVLDVHHCDQLKIFPTEDQDHPSDGDAIVPFEKGFPNIEQLPLDKEDIMRINCQAPFQANFLRKVKSLVLQCFHDYSDGFPYQFFRKELLPNLENLRVACSNFKDIFSSQRRDIDFDLGMLFPQLKGLELMSLQCLESIGLDQSWVSPILENLETLRVVRCPCLRNTVPSALSFSKLRQLFVYGRQGLVCLFTLSTARSLVLLEELVIGKCGSIQEIVPKKDDGSDEDELTFGKLIVLFLDSLQRLGSFHSGNSTLNFPCLKLVTVDECPRMRIFSCGSINASRHLRVSAKPSQNTSYGPEYCGPDLNGHIKLLFSSQHANCAQDISCLELCDHPELLEIWQRVVPVPNRGFCNLTNLTVHGCQSLTHVIPSQLVPFLCNLKYLTVRDCNAAKAIFDLSPMLPQGKLESLQELKVKNCEQLVEIVAWYETISGVATSNSIIFAGLTMLKLHTLPELKCIHPTVDNLEWPKLEKLVVYRCGQLKNFPPLGQDHFAKDTEATITLEKVLPNLKQLSLSKKHIMQIWQALLQEKLLKGVKFLKLKFFNDDSNEFPDRFFLKESMPHLEELRLSHSNFKEICTTQRSDLDGFFDVFFSQLKALKLISLSKLNSIGLEHAPLLGNLETMIVQDCPCLMNLAPSTVSFTSLKGLTIRKCDGLVYLFTSSTAKSLSLLSKLSVKNCESIQEIVAKGDESDQDDIAFENLKELDLELLPRLDSFYPGTYNLKFPSLEQVSIYGCSRMKVFSHADIYALDNVTIRCFGDKNLRAMMEKAFKKAAC